MDRAFDTNHKRRLFPLTYHNDPQFTRKKYKKRAITRQLDTSPGVTLQDHMLPKETGAMDNGCGCSNFPLPVLYRKK
jgi:hypothetical protein